MRLTKILDWHMMSEQENQSYLLGILAERVRERRKALGLTQEQLAEQAGLSTNFLARLEMSGRTPSLATLTRIAGALEVHPSDLLAEEHIDQWKAEATEIAHALNSLSQPDASLAVKLMRNIIGHLKKYRCHP